MPLTILVASPEESDNSDQKDIELFSDCIDCSDTLVESEIVSCCRCDGLMCDDCFSVCESCNGNVCDKCSMGPNETTLIDGFHEILYNRDYDIQETYCYYCIKVVFNV